jgi:hypothetical protein
MASNLLRIGRGVSAGHAGTAFGMFCKAAGWRGSAPRHVIVLLLCLFRPAGAQASEQVNGVPLEAIRVTCWGPRADLVFAGMAGISTLVEAGGERFSIDAGRGFRQRPVQAGVPVNAVGNCS